MEAAPTTARLKQWLARHEVDSTACLERSELLARYAEVKGRVDALREQRLRARANGAMQRKSFELAVRFYSEALCVPAPPALQAQLCANRSSAYFGLGLYSAALDDGRRAVELDPGYVKGFHRRGTAELALGRCAEAAETFEAALALVDSAEPRGEEEGGASGAVGRASAQERARAEEQRAVWRATLAEKLEQARNAADRAPPSAAEAPPSPRPPAPTGAEPEGAPPAPPAPLSAKLLDDPDLLHEVFSHLGAADVCAASAACGAFSRLGASQPLWQSLCERQFPESTGLARAPGGGFDWRVFFRERRTRAERWACASGEARGAVVSSLQGHAGPVYGVSLRGDILASSSEDGHVLLWDLATRRVLHTLSAHGTGILGVWLSPDCRRLASGGFDSHLKLWALPPLDGSADEGGAAPRVERNCLGHAGPIVSCLGVCGGSEAGSSAEHVLSTSFDGSLRQWSWAAGRLVRSYEEAHEGHACGLARDERSGLVYTGGDDSAVRAWDLRAAQSVDSSSDGHAVEGAVWALAVTGNLIAAGATGGSLTLWDVRRGLSGGALASQHGAHSDAIAGLQVADGGRALLTSSFDSTVRLWDLPGHSPPREGQGVSGLRLRATIGVPMTRCTRLAADDTLIVTGSIGQHLAVIDML